MKDEQHVTMTGNEAHTYTVVDKRWIQVITGMMVLMLVLVSILFYIAITNRAIIQSLGREQEIQRQRNSAMDEMLLNRAVPQIFSYNKACEYAKEKGQACLDNPQWWATPEKYPLLKGNPSGTGIFPIKRNEGQ